MEAHAEKPWIDIHLASNHATPGYYVNNEFREWNERNLGLGAEFPINSYVSYTVGGYHNSYRRTSLYTGADFHTHSWAFTGVGVMAGIVSGYEDKVMVLPYYRMGNRAVRVKFGIIPGEVMVMTLTAGVRW